MSLISKLFHTESPTLSAHTFAAIMRLYFSGNLGGATAKAKLETLLTRQNNGQAYVLDQGETDQLSELKSHFDGLTASQKQTQLDLVEGSMILAGYGDDVLLTRAEFKAFNGLTTD